MTTQQAFEKIVKENKLVNMMNDLVKIDEKLVYLVREWFLFAILMSKTNRAKELADMTYNALSNDGEMDVEKLLSVEIEEDELPMIYEKFVENIKNFFEIMEKNNEQRVN